MDASQLHDIAEIRMVNDEGQANAMLADGWILLLVGEQFNLHGVQFILGKRRKRK